MAQVQVRIPVEDLTRQYAQIRDEINAAIATVLPTGRYTLGPQVSAFEKEYAAYCQSRYAVGISNGTEALHLTLLALGIGPGDEVITVCNTYVATAFAVSYAGGRPVFVDIDSQTYNMDVRQIAAAITPRTRAIIPVHMYGQPTDMEPILELARRHGLHVIDDAAHAHGATYKSRKVGALAEASCFSFYPTKVLGAYGDGGAVTTSDDMLYDRLKVQRYMGQHTKHAHEIIGHQQRLVELQAAILRVKLRHLDGWITRRRRIASMYHERLKGLPVVTPAVAPENAHVYYVYTIRAERRDEVAAFLGNQGIGTQVMYPELVPFQQAYQDLGYRRGAFPVAERCRDEILCLPMFPELRDDEVHAVCDAVHTFYRG